MRQFLEILVPYMFGGKDLELLLRSGEYVAIHPHFNHEGFICGSSYLDGGVISIPFLLKKVKLLGESMHLKTLGDQALDIF